MSLSVEVSPEEYGLVHVRVFRTWQPLYPKKRQLRLPYQSDPGDCAEDRPDEAGVWQRNYASVADLTDNFLEVLDDQSKRGQVLKLSETAARGTFPDLVVAFLGALKSDNHR